MESIESILAKSKNSDLLENLVIDLWLAHVIGENQLYLFKNPSHQLGSEEVEKFWGGVKEMEKGKPLAQLIGVKEFYGYDFYVNENVLIPRPESELLVDIAKDFIEKYFSEQVINVLDVGTGSGCILLSLMKECPFVNGMGTEISMEALNVAKINAEKHGLGGRLELLQGDLMDSIDVKCQVVLANLPYIGTEKFNFIAGNVARYEPDVALFGGTDGLELYRRMFHQLSEKNWKPELVAGEFGFGQEEVMEKLLNEYFSEAEYRIIPDLAGIPRVFVVGSAS